MRCDTLCVSWKETMAEKPKPSVSAEDGDLISTFKNLWDYMWPKDRPDLRTRVVLAIIALLFAKAVATLIPFAYKSIIDSLGGSGENTAVLLGLAIPLIFVIAYGIGQLISVALEQLRDVLFAAVGQNAVRELANRTFEHMHKLSLRFHLARRTGGLSRVIERGTKGIEMVVRFTMLHIFPTMLELVIVAIIFAFYFGFSYLLVTFITITLYLAFTIRATNWRIGIRREMNMSDTEANSKAVDSLLNYETVKYFGNERLEMDRFDDSMRSYEKAAVRIWTSLATLNLGQGIIFWVGVMIMSLMSANSVMKGEMTLGDFVLLNTFLMQIYRPLSFIGSVYRDIRQGLTDIETMFSLLDESPEIQDDASAATLEIKGPVIKFNNVHFSYDPDREILKGVDFTVAAGKTTAVVGPSGAGKSTISRLLYRFYDVSSGSVTIDDQDLRTVTQASLRHAIGMVPQDTVLFNDTIAYNIRYGRPSATDEEVREAASYAQIDTFIESLPEGYNTQVGERGLKLSGGEKQRVAIARTILKAPPILILDEATSALDTETEREIQTALDTVSKGRTTLVIAHRLSTVVDADEIIVLRKGVIEERGTHSVLLAKNGLYSQMWDRQRESDEVLAHLKAVQEDPDGFLAPQKIQPAE